MKAERTPLETPQESTAAASFNELSVDETAELSRIEVMDLHDVNHVIDKCLIHLGHGEYDFPEQKEYLKKQLHESATELASHVLSKKSNEELGIKAQILDNQSFNHPPIREDIFRLAAASEALNDEKLRFAYETAIEELPPNLSNVKRRAERALKLMKSNRIDSFFRAYSTVELMDYKYDTEGRDIMASHAKRFFDHGELEDGVDYNLLGINDERLERLVKPIPTMMEGKYGTHDEPRVEFYYDAKKAGQKIIDGLKKSESEKR